MLTRDDIAQAADLVAAWGIGPRVFKNVLKEPVFTSAEFIQALATVAQAVSDGRHEPSGRASLDGRAPAIHELRAFFPAPDIRSFEQYQAQVASIFPEKEFSVILDKVDIALPTIRHKLTPLLHALFERVGYPVRGIHSCIYAGTYSTTPFGIHMDDCHVLMASGIGTKKMAFWPREYFEHRGELVKPGSPAHAGKELDALLADARILEIGPYDLLYWPAGYWHVAVNDTDQFRASLSVGIYHRGDTAEVLKKYIPMPPTAVANSNHRALDSLDLDGFDMPASAGVPERFDRMWETLRAQIGAEGAAQIAYISHVLSMTTSAGFGPLPEVEDASLCDDALIAVGDTRSLQWRAVGGKVVAAGNGQVFTFDERSDALDAWLQSAKQGEAVRVADVLSLVCSEHSQGLRAFLANARLIGDNAIA